MSKKGERNENMEQWEAYVGSCVLLDENGVCAVEPRHMCTPKHMTCPFHLTAEQKAESDAEWRARMNALTWEEQLIYAGEYYGGKMPWKEGPVMAAEETADGAVAGTGSE